MMRVQSSENEKRLLAHFGAGKNRTAQFDKHGSFAWWEKDIKDRTRAFSSLTLLAVRVPDDIESFYVVSAQTQFLTVEISWRGERYRFSGQLPEQLIKRLVLEEQKFRAERGDIEADKWSGVPPILKTYRETVLMRLIEKRLLTGFSKVMSKVLKEAQETPKPRKKRVQNEKEDLTRETCAAYIFRKGVFRRCQAKPLKGERCCLRHIERLLIEKKTPEETGVLVDEEKVKREVSDELLNFVTRFRHLNGKPFSLADYQHLLPLYQDLSDSMVIMKAAQMGITEWALNRALWFAYTKKENVIYTFPSRIDAGEFVQTRLDPALSQFEEIFKATKEADRKRWVDNRRIKQIGDNFLFIRGTRGESEALSVPAGLRIHDEIDRSIMRIVNQYRSRLEASQNKAEIFISNPTYSKTGIHKLFEESDQHHFFWDCDCGEVTCVCCGYPHIIIDHEFKCPKCKRVIDRRRLTLRALNPQGKRRGYHFSHLVDLRKSARDIEEAAENYEDIRDFYNFVLGLPYEMQTDRLTQEAIEACIDARYRLLTRAQGTYMGIDQGIYIVILRPLDDGRLAVVWVEKKDSLRGWDEIATLFDQFGVVSAVVDGEPDRLPASRLARKFPRRVWLAFYHAGLRDQELKWFDPVDIEQEEPRVMLNRTMNFDRLFTQILDRGFVFPPDSKMETLFAHLRNMRRVTEEVRGGLAIRYAHSGASDFSHALLYE